MPAAAPLIAPNAASALHALGGQLRGQRKALRISALATAGAAGLSRVTLHRIERGEPSVTMGAYLNAMAALGLDFGIPAPPTSSAGKNDEDRKDWIPTRIRLADYPQLKQLAWQIHGINVLTPAEALSIYERNGRHLDVQAMVPRERHLVDALRLAFGQGHV